LPSPESREEMKTHWRSVLEELAKLAGKNR
jgi:hypothetical protein